MTATFLTFRKFNDIALAKEIAARLEQGDIQYLLEDDSRMFDPSFANNAIDSDIRIKLRPVDFAKGDKVLEDFYRNSLDTVEEDYYLLSFTDEELMEIVSKPDEWGAYDYQLAQKLLKERGLEIKPEVAVLLKKQRINDLARPDTPHKYWIYIGYFSAILGGLFGIIIGWTLGYFKKTLPDGQRVHAFGEKDVKHGRRILLIAIISMAFWFIVNAMFGFINLIGGGPL